MTKKDKRPSEHSFVQDVCTHVEDVFKKTKSFLALSLIPIILVLVLVLIFLIFIGTAVTSDSINALNISKSFGTAIFYVAVLFVLVFIILEIVSFVFGVRCAIASGNLLNLLESRSSEIVFIQGLKRTITRLRIAIIIYLILSALSIFIPQILGIFCLGAYIFLFVSFFEIKRYKSKLLLEYN